MRPAVRCRRQSRRQGGQVVIIFALSFALFLMGLILLVINVTSLYKYDAVLRKAAQDGAIAGASNVNIPHFQSTGQVSICGCAITSQYGPGPPFAGTNPCVNAVYQDLSIPPGGPPGGVVVHCQIGGVNNSQVTVTVSYAVRLMGLPPTTETRTYTAFAQCGTDTATGAC